jgi:hypothetical protein
VQTAKRPDAADGHRDQRGHPGLDSPVEQDSATGCLANIDELPGVLIARLAPTEPQVTNVTPASTAGVLIGDDQRIVARMLGQPVLRLLVKGDKEPVGHIVEYAFLRPSGFISARRS